MQQSCHECRTTFEITDDELAFIGKLSPKVGGVTFPLPPPTHCPECRQQRRYACRNDRNYYPGTCHVCKKSLITSYSEDKHIPVLCDGCFWGDGWDPLTYGLDIDFSKTFFEQFAMLRGTVPRLAIYHTQSENSEYTVHSSRNRNCYMASSLVDNEDVHYSDLTFESKDCTDLFSCMKMELCYECTFCEECFQCEYCENCTSLTDSMLCFDCRGSNHLIGCVGVRSKENRILNENASVEECRRTAQKLKTDPVFRKSFEQKFQDLKLRHPHRDAWLINTENSTGNYIWNSRNARFGFNVRRMEDAWYAYEEHSGTDTYDTCRVANGEMLYDCSSIVDLKFGAFCNLTYQCSNLLYCDNCNGTMDSFGCVSLKRHRYCILNTQYEKSEYEKLVPKIIEHMRKTGEWGEFFPIVISPFGYNESKAHEWYPLTREEVLTGGWPANRSAAPGSSSAHLRQGYGGQPSLREGWKWSDYEPPEPKVKKTLPGMKLPSSIADIPDDILNWAIVCEISGKPFRIIAQELAFYRKRGLSIPRRSPKQRHYDRIRPLNIRTLYDRTCQKCQKPIRSIYSPDRPETVYCESCYLKTVY